MLQLKNIYKYFFFFLLQFQTNEIVWISIELLIIKVALDSLKLVNAI